MTPVSAVIITFNEAQNIRRCLSSLTDIVDEIVVVDAYSTDETSTICAEFGVRFIQREWQGYSATKNFANQQATHSYILSVDADEEPDHTLKQSVLEARKNGLNGAYRLNRKTNYCGRWVRFCGWYPDKKIRLFPKDAAIWQGDFVHENLELKKGVKVHPLPGHLNHYSYHSVQDHRNRIEKYARLHAQKMHHEGKKTSHGRAVFSAFWKFLQVYFFKLGFLDGAAGWHIAVFSARAVFLKYRYLLELHNQPTK